MGHVIMNNTLTVLTLIGIWPKNKKSTKTTAYLLLLSCCPLLIGSLGYLIVYRKFGLKDIDAIETATSQFGILYFSTFYVVKREGIENIVKTLSDFSKFGKPRFFETRERQLDYLLRYCVVVLTIATCGVFLCPYLYAETCIKIQKQLNETTRDCGLVSPMWLPFDYSKKSVKIFVFGMQSYCCFVSYGCAGFVSFTLIETMEHLIMRIEQLKEMFSEVTNEPNIVRKNEKLKNWVTYHLELYDIGKIMDDNYRYCLSVIVLSVGILFGCIGVTEMRGGSSHGSIFLFGGWFQSVCILCICGQRLLDSSLSVGLHVYESDWYEHDVSFQKSVLLIMMRSQKPILINAGPFTYISHLLLLTVAQSSYSYINLLNASS